MTQTAIILTPDNFERFTSEMREHITKQVETIKGSVIEKPMCVKEAADYLRIAERTLYARIQSGAIPSNLVHRVDGSVYFFPSELCQFIKKN
jgi:excisionase family DNA binding protein